MLPSLALLAGFVLIWWMFREDRRWRELPSTALWVPGIWLALSSSRQLSFWLQQIGFGGGGSSNLEGSPINVVFNTSLFIIALVVLKRRNFSWLQWAFSNKAVVAIYAFFLFSMLWSPFPFPTLKRVIQDFGSALIALIIVTEQDPGAALRVVLVPVCVRPVPALRHFHQVLSKHWTGCIGSLRRAHVVRCSGSQEFPGTVGHGLLHCPGLRPAANAEHTDGRWEAA